MNKKIEHSLRIVENWIESQNYKGYEHYDALSSVLSPLTFNNLLAERILTQFVRRFPFNIRPLIGIKPQDSTKGRGYMAWGYLAMFKLSNNQKYKTKAEECLQWLIANKSQGYSQHSWGNHFDYSARGGKLPKYEPIIVWTSLIGQAFLDAYEIIRDNKYLEIAVSICEWIMNLPREKTAHGTCLSYVMYKQSSIHNSNMLGAAMLARTARIIKDTNYLQIAHAAMLYSCSRQLPNGAWYYGEATNLHWIDNFHTGYNLDSLKCYIDNVDTNEFKENLHRGLKYYITNFFKNNGIPAYYHNQIYPIDIQCAAQAIDTLINCSDYDNSAFALAKKVANWTIDKMQSKDGFFYYRKTSCLTIKIPMFHWGQTTMYKALSNILTKLYA